MVLVTALLSLLNIRSGAINQLSLIEVLNIITSRQVSLVIIPSYWLLCTAQSVGVFCSTGTA